MCLSLGRKRLYASNSERQRAFQEKLRRERLDEDLARAKANILQVQPKQSNEDIVKRWLHGKSIPEAKAAYQSFLRIYRSIKQDYLFGIITKYLDERTPLANGISLGEMETFLESLDPKVECPVCHYFRSILEEKCPECELKVTNPQAWRAYRKTLVYS